MGYAMRCMYVCVDAKTTGKQWTEGRCSYLWPLSSANFGVDLIYWPIRTKQKRAVLTAAMVTAKMMVLRSPGATEVADFSGRRADLTMSKKLEYRFSHAF